MVAVYNYNYSEKTNHTIGVEFGTRIVEAQGERIKIQAWDTAGQERFRSVTRSYYRGSIGTILVYDITNRESFEDLDKWMVDARQLTPPHSIFVLVGNKADREASQRMVSYEEGETYARDNDMLFVEASAKTGSQVEDVFLQLASRILKLVKDGIVKPSVPDSGVQSMKPLSDTHTQGTSTSVAAAATDVIYPPQDIKTIVDKTAEHVAKSGEAFQQLIRDKYQGNVRFSFIYPNDPYFAYYDMMVSKFRSGSSSNDDDDDNKDAASALNLAASLNATDPTDVDQNAPEVPEQPENTKFINAMPAISAQDMDVIKLTAQFVACNGRSFMTSLAQREQANYQFDFLLPTHSLFGYFRKLVEQYTMVYNRSEELTSRLTSDIDDKFQILERVDKKMKWEAYEAKQKKKKEEEIEKERTAFLSIDWHDFVVVGTVEFVEEDAYIDLPAPLRLQDLKSMSLEQKRKTVAGDSTAGAGSSMAQVEATQPAPEIRHVGSTKPTYGADEEEDNDVDMEVEMDEDDDEDVDEEIEAEKKPDATTKPAAPTPLGNMKVRKNYVPSLRSGPQAREVTLQCQLCKQEIPASEFEEHIRVELIDPKWKEQKLVYERKIRDSNLVQEGMDIARYLKQMAGHRTDIFGADGENTQEDQQQTHDAGSNKVYWDGYSSTAGQATKRAKDNMSEEERTAAKYRKKGLDDPRDPSLKIGPQMIQTRASERRKN
ncbi:SF3a splicing factor complex subunit [Coemansia sp. RSA 1843]|nr:SF3a splicing factor complex subunit [Coemansia sp. RSA 1843]